jgi:hypothetical protein
MRTKLARLVFGFVAVLAFASSSLPDAPKPPFSLAIVPTSNGDGGGSIEMALKSRRDFYVVLTNVSSEPQRVWQTWNSWGYQTVSFDFATKDGKKYAVTKRDEEFTRNFPSTFLVPPGEHEVFAVHLDESWVTHPPFPKADEMPITVKAIYEVPPTPEASQHKVWTGRVESHTYDLTLRQW